MARGNALKDGLVNHGLLGVVLIGAVYLITYMWPLWPVTMALLTSGVAVGTIYLFLGGYAWWRALESPRHGHVIAIRPMLGVLLVAAAWDIVSPFVLRDFNPISIVGHVTGGTLALVLSAVAAWGRPELRGARPRHTVRGVP